MAQVDYFLKLDGIDGESPDDKHKGEIDVLSWSWGATNTGAMGQGGAGGGAGKVQAQDFHFVMLVNKASAKVLQGVCGGTHIASALLTCRKAGETPQEFLKITLTDCLVTSFQTGGSSGAEIVPTDQMSLNFAKIKYEYGAQDSKGKVSSLDQKAGYDFQASKKI